MLPESADRVAVAGPAELVAAFRAAGLDAYPTEAGPESAARVEELIRRGYRIVFFTADLTPYLEPLLLRYSRHAAPCLVPLPLDDAGAGAARLRALVRRAVGANVFKTPGKEND